MMSTMEMVRIFGGILATYPFCKILNKKKIENVHRALRVTGSFL
jgi:hypothetical protein